MTGNQTPQITPKASFKQYCRQESETAKLAKAFAVSIERWISQSPHGHLNISLEGDLGAGKTTFARYLIQGPDKAEGTLPPFDIQIQLQAGADENERSITINALSEAGKTAIDSIDIN